MNSSILRLTFTKALPCLKDVCHTHMEFTLYLSVASKRWKWGGVVLFLSHIFLVHISDSIVYSSGADSDRHFHRRFWNMRKWPLSVIA